MAREKFRFWLDMNKDEELGLAEQIDELKTQRLFTATIRDGIRLVCSLRREEWGVLFTLFPWIEREINERIMQVYQEANERPIQIIQQQAVQIGQGAPPPSGPRAMQTPQLAAPIEDDDEIGDLIKKDTSTTSAANFLKSMNNLVG